MLLDTSEVCAVRPGLLAGPSHGGQMVLTCREKIQDLRRKNNHELAGRSCCWKSAAVRYCFLSMAAMAINREAVGKLKIAKVFKDHVSSEKNVSFLAFSNPRDAKGFDVM